MASTLTPTEEAQLGQTIEMFEVIVESQPQDYQSLEILKEAYLKLGRDQDVVKTSKRIAEAYVHLGQLSSAILEYETVLQRYPDDPDVRNALKQIESQANNFADQLSTAEPVAGKASTVTPRLQKTARTASEKIEDGRAAMHKIFVEAKIITAGDFDLCWVTSDASTRVTGIVEPFIQVLADKGVLSVDKSLKLVSDKSRVGFLPLEKYDVDIDLARGFPAEVCQRWCMLPFDRMSKSILVATANPFNQDALRALSAATPNRLLLYLAPPIEIIKNLRKAFR